MLTTEKNDMIPFDVERYLLLTETAQQNLRKARDEYQLLQNCEVLRWYLKDFAGRLEADKPRLPARFCKAQETVIQILCTHALQNESISQRIAEGDTSVKIKRLRVPQLRRKLTRIYQRFS